MNKEKDFKMVASSWINAVLPRFWWNLFENKSFHKFIVKRLGKRIAKITDFPDFIVFIFFINFLF